MADAARSPTWPPATPTTAPAISISTFPCGWRATTSVFLVPCSSLVTFLFCGARPGGPDFDPFRPFPRDPHRLRTPLLGGERQRTLRAPFLLRRLRIARALSA